MSRRADHHSGADLITDFTQYKETVLAILQAQFSWVQISVVLLICSLMTQKIPIRTGIIKRLIALAIAFAQREGDGTVRVFLPNCAHKRNHSLIGEIRVLSALQHKGAKAERVSLLAALKDLLNTQPIPLRILIAAANAAVIAIISADVCEFDQSAQENGLPIGFVLNRSRSFIEIRLIVH